MESKFETMSIIRRPRKWTLREDNQSHHHSVGDLEQSPLELRLSWRKTAKDPVIYVGTFSLDLEELLSGGFVRRETTRSDERKIRLRIVKEADGSFYVQTRRNAPKYLLVNG